MEKQLNFITELAKKGKEVKINNLIYLLDVDNLRECFYMLRKHRAVGIDGTSLEDYETKLDENLTDLVSRMKTWSYKPKPVKRAYIPKANGKMRPLGIPSIEDKIVQMGITRILEAIYEEDFYDMSYGFRKRRGCHEALDKLDKTIMKYPINYIIDADIKGFFDNVNHDVMEKCLRERISDENFIRLIKRFLIGGVMEEGIVSETEKGTPQGGILSPMLANIYLHYVLDLWIERDVKGKSNGFVDMIRYADDFVICAQYEKEAKMIRIGLEKRLGKYHLELAEDKTRTIEFGRNSEEKARGNGKKPDTFNFLGFTHFIDKTKRGKFKVGRKTDRKKYRIKMKEMYIWLKEIRNKVEIKEWWKIFCAKLRGHFQYFGVSGNFYSIRQYFWETVKMLFKWLNRRSQKKSFNWENLLKYIDKWKIPKPRIYHDFYTLYGY